jgi:hypothetical protein
MVASPSGGVTAFFSYGGGSMIPQFFVVLPNFFGSWWIYIEKIQILFGSGTGGWMG